MDIAIATLADKSYASLLLEKTVNIEGNISVCVVNQSQKGSKAGMLKKIKQIGLFGALCAKIRHIESDGSSLHINYFPWIKRAYR